MTQQLDLPGGGGPFTLRAGYGVGDEAGFVEIRDSFAGEATGALRFAGSEEEGDRFVVSVQERTSFIATIEAACEHVEQVVTSQPGRYGDPTSNIFIDWSRTAQVNKSGDGMAISAGRFFLEHGADASHTVAAVVRLSFSEVRAVRNGLEGLGLD